jgi:hypothetical protein
MVLGLAWERWPTARLTVIPERFDAGTSSGRRREQGKLSGLVRKFVGGSDHAARA